MSMSRSGLTIASLRGFGVTLPLGCATSTPARGAPVGARTPGAQRPLTRAR
jgi:hypothetical protein